VGVMDNSRLIGAVVMAAGRSSRMGQPKMVLPWGSTTVICQVVAILDACDVSPIVVVTGGAADLVELALKGTSAVMIRNPNFAVSEMLVSIQIGLSAMPAGVQACLVCLGDQPQMEASVVERLILRYQQSGCPLVVPSYQKRRGHPWLLDRSLWDDILAMGPDDNLRRFLNRHENVITYENVDTPSVLKDLDTPEDYQADRPHPKG
jgi:molybdenum cofactor cytidylyltransferase